MTDVAAQLRTAADLLRARGAQLDDAVLSAIADWLAHVADGSPVADHEKLHALTVAKLVNLEYADD